MSCFTNVVLMSILSLADAWADKGRFFNSCGPTEVDLHEYPGQLMINLLQITIATQSNHM